MKAWSVPVECIRASTTVASQALVVRLVGEGALFEPDATVELAPSGFIATVRYKLSPHASRQHAVTLCLDWAPAESRAVAA